MSLYLGIDVGTSGVRCAVIDAQGQHLASASAPHFAQDPEQIDAQLWWQTVQQCIAAQIQELARLGYSAGAIEGIAIDGTSGTMVLTDAELTPVTRALMYHSSGFEREAEAIARYAPPSHITSGSSSALARAMRLASETQNARHLLHQADFIAAKLMGHGGCSDYNNALKTGFDPESEIWPQWLSAVLDETLLPQPQPIGTALGTLSPSVARSLGLAESVVVYAGTTDSIAAFLACAPLSRGVAVTSLGTTLVVKTLSQQRIDAPEMGLYSHRVGQYWLAGGASNTGGGALLQHFSADQLSALSAQINPDKASPLDYYPLPRPGERFPINDPSLMPRVEPRPASDAEFLHGLLESIARIEQQCYRAIEERGGDYPVQLFSAGGGAHNHIWTRIRARVLGLEPQQSQYSEAAIGAARIAAGSVLDAPLH